METNFEQKTNLILSNEDNTPIAIIECDASTRNKKGIVLRRVQITDKLELAIKEDRDADTVQIVDSTTIDKNSEPVKFSVHIYVDGSDYYEIFTLHVATTY